MQELNMLFNSTYITLCTLCIDKKKYEELLLYVPCLLTKFQWQETYTYKNNREAQVLARHGDMGPKGRR